MIPILFEDNHLLVVNKPPGMATMGDDVRDTVHQVLCDYLRQAYAKPGKVFLGVVHRLDALASGVLVMARTSKAASRLSEQFRRESENVGKENTVSPSKSYLVAVESHLEPAAEFRLLTDRIRKNEALHRMETVAGPGPKNETATLRYRVCQNLQSRKGRVCSLLQVQLLTGRKHQIRVQMASRNMPVFGDKKYGAAETTSEAIALHAWKLTLQHPTLKRAMTFTAPLPSHWKSWFPGIDLQNTFACDAE